MSRLQSRNDSSLMTERQLTLRLKDEFAGYDNASQTYRQPLISVEAALGRRHILVIWDAWYSLSQQERSQIIMNAFEASEGIQEALTVSIATGLTQDDATHLGVDFVPAPL